MIVGTIGGFLGNILSGVGGFLANIGSAIDHARHGVGLLAAIAGVSYAALQALGTAGNWLVSALLWLAVLLGPAGLVVLFASNLFRRSPYRFHGPHWKGATTKVTQLAMQAVSGASLAQAPGLSDAATSIVSGFSAPQSTQASTPSASAAPSANAPGGGSSAP